MENKLISTNKRLLCPLCGTTDRHGWCMVTSDLSMVLCNRSDGKRNSNINSYKYIKTCAAGGQLFIHKSIAESKEYKDAPEKFEPIIKEKPPLDFDLWRFCNSCYWDTAGDEKIESLAEKLNVDSQVLYYFGIGYYRDDWQFDAASGNGGTIYGLDTRESGDIGSYTIPLFDWQNKVIGVRLRVDDGRRCGFAGGKNGIIRPSTVKIDSSPLYICEGESDVAVALDMGLNVIGRPGCNAAVPYIKQFVKRSYRDVIIISDADDPGVKGAKSLAAEIQDCCKSVKVIMPKRADNDLRGARDSGNWDKRAIEQIALNTKEFKKK